MQHLRSLQGISLGKTWLTIGVFDGVHRGHQEILKALTAGAKAAKASAVVLSFYPHPAAVLGKRENLKYLSPPDEKAALLAKFGVDALITHPFDLQISSLSPDDFMGNIQRHLRLEKLLVGYDFALGKGRQGDAAYLKKMGLSDGYTVQRFDPFLDADGIISSSRVRDALADGNVLAAQQLLGHPYALSGSVIHGDGRGRKINIPTANIDLPREKAIPANGVYACRVYVDGVKYPAVTNVGIRPTFTPDKAEANIEAHLLDFDRDLYEKELRLEFIDHLRPEKKFNGVDELLAQIGVDIKKAREILA
ncbi:MAG: bifunctional riboflavin kinase/FAD synthetase [Anaerolineae bacterium]|jgi:riboflavin kinase / FMN adenylyltransferase|nr:bifunctional riboflavin kinase/FAD synthetase [Anaerolineae bacterium]MBT7072810.1 bifunctional riboflavin kinase/FAD synthetase [Anaerolineae bacterium]MBT7323813.1 bifunctional riboflavin kinase/FAD synthetase [Anaerolineae bacterium]